MIKGLLIFLFIGYVSGFQMNRPSVKNSESKSFQPIIFDDASIEIKESDATSSNLLHPALVTSAVTLLLPLQEAQAKGGAFGLWEGRTASLLHPATMAALFFTSLYSGYLGLQWRRLRTIKGEFDELNAQLPALSTTKAKLCITIRFSRYNIQKSR